MITLKKFRKRGFQLYKSALVSQEVNYNLLANTFYPITTLDISKLDLNRLIVKFFGHNISQGSDNASEGGTATLALINSTTGYHPVFASYKITNGNLQVGFISDSTPATVTSPYSTVYISYYIFTY